MKWKIIWKQIPKNIQVKNGLRMKQTTMCPGEPQRLNLKHSSNNKLQQQQLKRQAKQQEKLKH